MGNLCEHAAGDCVILNLYGVADAADTEAAEILLLALGLAVGAYCLGDFKFCHSMFLLAFKNFAHGDTAQACNSVGVPHFGEGGNGSLYEVVRVGRALALCKHVLNTCTLEYGAHCTAGLNTGTGSSGFHEHLGSAERTFLLMRDGGVDDGNLYEVLLCILHALRDSGSDFVGFSKTIAYDTVLVTDDNDGGKAEVTATLGNLGYALDSYEPVLEFEVRRLYSLNICKCHRPEN